MNHEDVSEKVREKITFAQGRFGLKIDSGVSQILSVVIFQIQQNPHSSWGFKSNKDDHGFTLDEFQQEMINLLPVGLSKISHYIGRKNIQIFELLHVMPIFLDWICPLSWICPFDTEKNAK